MMVPRITKLLPAFVLLFITSCYYDVEEELYPRAGCETDNVKYSTHIKATLQNYNCISCHNTAFASGGVTLDSYEAVKLQADNGALLGTVRYEDGYVGMPVGGDQLSTCDISEIEVWIAAGAPNN